MNSPMLRDTLRLVSCGSLSCDGQLLTSFAGVMQDMQGVNQNNALMNPDGSITSLGGWVSGLEQLDIVRDPTHS